MGARPTPLFFVSVADKGVSPVVSLLFATLAGEFIRVAAKGLSPAASLLFATLAGESISVVAKGLTGTKCWRESNGLGWEDFGEVRRTTWRARIGRGTKEVCPCNFANYTISVLFVK